MPMSVYEAIWIFLIYAFLGWAVEVAFAAFCTGTFVNRGFLNGPICPVYGCGVLAVIVVLDPLRDNVFLLFAGSFVLVSAIEFLTGFLLEKLFHNKWWDYSERKFNICGYVCPLFSILWGIGCTLILRVFHPAIYKIIGFLPLLPGIAMLVAFCIVFGVDLAITVASILKFNERLRLLDEIAGKIKIVSDEIGENIYEGVAVAMEKGGELKESMDTKAAELRENIDVRAAEIKENIDVRASEFRESIDVRASEIKENIDVRAAGFKESVDLKAAPFKDARSEKRAERARLQHEYNRLLTENVTFGMKRLMRAFPRMKSRAYQEALLKWKGYWEEKRRK